MNPQTHEYYRRNLHFKGPPGQTDLLRIKSTILKYGDFDNI